MGNREPGWELEVGNRGEPRTGLGSRGGEPGGTENQVGKPILGTKGNREPRITQNHHMDGLSNEEDL